MQQKKQIEKIETNKYDKDILIGRAKRIKELGANASKELPEEF